MISWPLLFTSPATEEVELKLKTVHGDKTKEYLEGLLRFHASYQRWYSEAKTVVKQLLPHRLNDFVGHYEQPKSRKDINYESYRIQECLLGLSATCGNLQKIAGPEGAILHFQQQLAILESVKARFESSLFDIKQLVQADLFDSELETAGELLKHKFLRAAGAVAGVVLEKHLKQVCANHSVTIGKKNPSLSEINDALKDAGVLQHSDWRYNQHLGDLRNLCDHDKEVEPTKEQVNDLIVGVQKVTKTIF